MVFGKWWYVEDNCNKYMNALERRYYFSWETGSMLINAQFEDAVCSYSTIK